MTLLGYVRPSVVEENPTHSRSDTLTIDSVGPSFRVATPFRRK
jgi:hypothetical protein